MVWYHLCKKGVANTHKPTKQRWDKQNFTEDILFCICKFGTICKCSTHILIKQNYIKMKKAISEY